VMLIFAEKQAAHNTGRGCAGGRPQAVRLQSQKERHRKKYRRIRRPPSHAATKEVRGSDQLKTAVRRPISVGTLEHRWPALRARWIQDKTDRLIMAGRYPNALFHYTQEKHALWGILEDNFRISYARERIVGEHEKVGFAAPMVSFCDLRLSEAADHIGTYGKYGIGLSKEWAVRQQLNPVSYWNRKSHLADTTIRSMKKFFDHVQKIDDLDDHLDMARLYHDLLDIYRVIKNYEGDLIRKDGIVTPNYRFADEREWRYVPAWESSFRAYVPLDEINTDEKKAEFNSRIGEMRLEFEPGDIRYLIISDEHERDELIEHIRHAKRKFDDATISRLSSRILTVKQIEEDF